MGGDNGSNNTPPTVVEECNRNLNNCQERRLPSPSPLTPLPANWSTTPPWTDDGTNLACTNAVITASFDKLIDHATLVVSGSGKTIIVNKCGSNGNNCNTPIEHSSVRGKEFAISNSTDQTAFIFTPSALEQYSWYEVTLTTGIKYKKEKNNEYTHSNLILVLDKNGVIKLYQQGLDKNYTSLIELIKKLSY